jgi:hypothetical protein
MGILDIKLIWAQSRQKVGIRCDDEHVHTALLGCLYGDNRDVNICKLCEFILKQESILNETIKKIKELGSVL